MEYDYAYFGLVKESEVIDFFKSELEDFKCLSDGDSKVWNPKNDSETM